MDGPKDPLAGSLGASVHRLHRAMHAEMTRRLAEFGVTPPEWAAIAYFHETVDTPAALADSLHIDRALATRTIAGLEAKGLIVRRPNEADGRSTRIELSTQARKLLPKLAAVSRELNRQFLSPLSEAEASMLLSLMAKAVDAIPPEAFRDARCRVDP